MNRELVFIVYVSDIQKSVDFYKALLEIETTFETPRYVTFGLAEGVALALWTGESSALRDQPPEAVLPLPSSADSWALHGHDGPTDRLISRGAHDHPVGRTLWGREIPSDPYG